MRSYTLLKKARFSKEGASFVDISLPHTWNALDGQDGGDNYYRGECTYTIPLPAPCKGKRQYVEFQGANHVASVWCNDVLLGTHKGGFSTFRFELTDALREKENSLTVKVSNEECDIYPQKADFTFFGGIYRKAYLIEVEKEHFDLMKSGSSAVFVTPSVSGSVRIDAFPVCGEDCRIKFEIFDGAHTLVAETETNAVKHSLAEMTVPSPHLWQGTADPYLYTLKASLVKNGTVLDEVTERFGFRSYRMDPQKGFFLNGVSTPLHGVSRHQDRENMGWAISEKEHEEDLALILEVGANTVRLAHYQHDEYFYDLCDEAGLAVWAEIPYISAHRKGKDAFDNTLSQMTELIAQCYNHPSVLVWGIANEILIGGECEEQHQNLRALNALCKKIDPSRPTTIAQLSRTEYDSIHNEITDLVGYNNYYGWYVGTIEDNAAKMDEFHALHPDKPYGISEYGVDNLITWHSAKPFNHDHTEEYACLYHHYMLKEFQKRPWLWATYMWNMFDFAADARVGGGIRGRNCKGLITYDRKIKKDIFFLYQAFWTKEKTVYIAGRRFEDRAPDERDVSVFTSCPEVTLYLNGIRLATKKAIDHLAVFENVPLIDGRNELKAVADGVEDTILLNGVSEHNTAYDLPDITAAIGAGNWFSQNETAVDYGENGYSCGDNMETLCSNEDCLTILKGWAMSLEQLDMGQKLRICMRLPEWKNTPVSIKTPRQLKTLQGKCNEEDFQKLDKMLRSIKRS